MAVTKIRKISSWSLLACTAITLVVLGMFFFGGDNEPYKGEYWSPAFLDLFLNWQYILFGLCAASTLFFGIWQFASSFKTNAKGSLMALGVILLFFVLLFLTYTIGSENPVNVVNSEAQAYNVPFWLKVTDMWLYTTYTLTGLVVLAIFAGSFRRIFNK